MSIEHTRALVAAACKIPGVQDNLPPDWFWPYCPTCGEPCDYSTAPERNNESVIICIPCGCDVPAPELRFEPDTEAGSPHMAWGPDFADERNLWALIALCDALLYPRRVSVLFNTPSEKFYAGGFPHVCGDDRASALIAFVEWHLVHAGISI